MPSVPKRSAHVSKCSQDQVQHVPPAVLAGSRRNGATGQSIRCDDSGIGGSTGILLEIDHEGRTGDALSMVRILSEDSRIKPSSVGILGPSEGGVIALMMMPRLWVALEYLLKEFLTPAAITIIGRDRYAIIKRAW